MLSQVFLFDGKHCKYKSNVKPSCYICIFVCKYVINICFRKCVTFQDRSDLKMLYITGIIKFPCQLHYNEFP
jgi:hypothetical protein